MNIKEVKEKKTIKEWEIEKGIRVNDPKGFKRLFRQNRRVYDNLYTEKQFRLGILYSDITVKTEKGLEFLLESREKYKKSNKVTQ